MMMVMMMMMIMMMMMTHDVFHMSSSVICSHTPTLSLSLSLSPSLSVCLNQNVKGRYAILRECSDLLYLPSKVSTMHKNTFKLDYTELNFELC